MPARSITCINEDNVSITLTDKFSPWELQTAEGLYEMNSPVNTLANTMSDGSTYQGSQVAQRNIILTLRDADENHMDNRALLYMVFKPKAKGQLRYTENDVTRIIDYYVEKAYIDAINRARAATISLICPDPYFRDQDGIVVSMADWRGQFEFEHEFTSGGEAFGYRNNEQIKTITNFNADGIGLTITLTANGSVTNPSIHHVEQQKHIYVGTNSKPFSMAAGDQLIISTHTNNKHIWKISNGATVEVNEYLSEDSDFIQLAYGDNNISYDAASGVGYLTVDIAYQYKYLGV